MTRAEYGKTAHRAVNQPVIDASVKFRVPVRGLEARDMIAPSAR